MQLERHKHKKFTKPTVGFAIFTHDAPCKGETWLPPLQIFFQFHLIHQNTQITNFI